MEDINSITHIEITHEGQPQVVLIGDTFTFQVKADNSTDVTAESTFRVDGNTIVGNTFTTSNVPKEYVVEAHYQDIISEPIIVIASDGYPKNVLIEDYTGTWCGNCPRVSYAIEQVKEQTDRVVSVAIHISDSYAFDGGIAVNDAFEISSYPNARLNRIHKWTAPEPDNIAEAVNQSGLAPLGLAMSSSQVGNEIHLTCKTAFKETFTQPLKLVLYLVENELIQDQENYTSYYGGDATIVDFEHNDVLRAIYTHHLGDQIPAAQTIENTIYEMQTQEAIPVSVEDSSKLHIVAFVVNATTNEVLNAREAAIGEIQTFE